jgi:hypothetical protein
VSQEPTETELKLIAAIKDSPRLFIEEILGEKLDAQQIQAAELFPHSRRMTVKSGHACGKDWLAARLALWFHVTHYPSIVVTTGPTDRQVRQIVWGEIRQAYKRAELRAQEGIGVRIGGTLLPEAPHLKSSNPHHYMLGFTAGEDAAVQGFHAPNVLVIVTEAQGINPKLWLGLESLLTAANSKLLLVGNAIYEPESEFFASFESKSALYRCITLDSEKSTYCSPEYVEDTKTVFGVDSPVYLARVKGVFPTDIADTLIPLGWIERAHDKFDQMRATWTPGHAAETVVGVDVARFGTDHTVFVSGVGDLFEVFHDTQGVDLMTTCGYIAKHINSGVPAQSVRIDDTGMGGGVTDRLHELGHKVRPINFGSKPTDDVKYLNARAEMFWCLRERFRTGSIAIPRSDRTMTRDLAIIKSKMTSKGQIALESKQEIKTRLGYSPDRADALALAAMPHDVAADLETGAVPGRGLLEFAEMMAKAASSPKLKAVSSRPASEIPGSGILLETSKDRADAGGMFH